MFEALGLKWGVEICSDYGVFSNAGVNNLDILVHVACGCSVADKAAVRLCGCVIIVDGEYGGRRSVEQVRSKPHERDFWD